MFKPEWPQPMVQHIKRRPLPVGSKFLADSMLDGVSLGQEARHHEKVLPEDLGDHSILLVAAPEFSLEALASE